MRRRRRPAEKWISEAALCAAVIASLEKLGFVVHAETLGYDLVAVRDDIRIGFEAKLTGNVKVLAQAIMQHADTVHYRGVIVGTDDAGFRAVARLCELVCISQPCTQNQRSIDYTVFAALSRMPRKWAETVTGELLAVPAAVAAGSPAPRKVTPWKLKAVRFCNDYRGKQFTRKQLQAYGMSFTTWDRRFWVHEVGKLGRAALYELTERDDVPDRAYPEVLEAVRASKAAGDNE